MDRILHKMIDFASEKNFNKSTSGESCFKGKSAVKIFTSTLFNKRHGHY